MKESSTSCNINSTSAERDSHRFVCLVFHESLFPRRFPPAIRLPLISGGAVANPRMNTKLIKGKEICCMLPRKGVTVLQSAPPLFDVAPRTFDRMCSYPHHHHHQTAAQHHSEQSSSVKQQSWSQLCIHQNPLRPSCAAKKKSKGRAPIMQHALQQQKKSSLLLKIYHHFTSDQTVSLALWGPALLLTALISKNVYPIRKQIDCELKKTSQKDSAACFVSFDVSHVYKSGFIQWRFHYFTFWSFCSSCKYK